MKKVIIQEVQQQRLFEAIRNEGDEMEFSFSPEDLDYYGMDFSQPSEYIPDDEDDSEDEEDFLSKTLELLESGAQSFNNLKDYYINHPYAMNHGDELKMKLDKIEKIITQIEEMFQ